MAGFELSTEDGAVQHVHATEAIAPVVAGVNSMSTGWFNGSVRLMFNDGNTTSVPQVLSVVRRNVMRAGVAARSVNVAGS